MYGGEMDYQSLFTFILEMAGTIAFAASGAMVGAQRGMDIFGICVLGVVTAVGGGATRDIILGIVPPGMFQNPIYTIVAVSYTHLDVYKRQHQVFFIQKNVNH